MCRGYSGIEFSEYGLPLYAAYDAEIGDSCASRRGSPDTPDVGDVHAARAAEANQLAAGFGM